MSTRFRVIYPYFKNSHNFVSLILIKKNQYPSFSNCFSIIFPLYQRNRVINFESSTYSHNSVPLILNQNKKKKSIYLFFNISLISRKNRVVNSAAFEQPNLRPRENYLPKVSTTTPLRERKKKKKGNTCDRKGVNGAVPSNN